MASGKSNLWQANSHHLLVDNTAAPKVGNLECASLIDEQVFGLEVTVHDAVVVQVVEPEAGLAKVLERVLFRKPSTSNLYGERSVIMLQVKTKSWKSRKLRPGDSLPQ